MLFGLMKGVILFLNELVDFIKASRTDNNVLSLCVEYEAVCSHKGNVCGLSCLVQLFVLWLSASIVALRFRLPFQLFAHPVVCSFLGGLMLGCDERKIWLGSACSESTPADAVCSLAHSRSVVPLMHLCGPHLVDDRR